jgi:ABC-type nitrate/sulfonate/bicarbonate transport system permease component
MVVHRDQVPRTIETKRDPNKKGLRIDSFYTLGIVAVACIIWYFAGNKADNSIILPKFQDTVKAFIFAVTDLFTLGNLGITMRRVLIGAVYAIIIGVPLGILMGYSKTAHRTLAPFINSVRQVPIMAWVPLAIIWFGLGDGPTIFLIAFTGVFTVVINTINGVHDIDINYYHAARSLGAKRWQVFRDVIIPGSFPGIFTGVRLAIGLGWMSVI